MKPIFNNLGHTGKPDLKALYGMILLPSVARTTYGGWTDPAGLPTSQWYDELAAAQHPVDNWLMVDHETWPVSSQAERLTASSNFVTVYHGIKSRRPDLKIMFYSWPTNRDWFDATKFPGHADYMAWQAKNTDFATMASVVDAFAPSVYGFYDRADDSAYTVSGMSYYIERNIAETKRLRQQFGHGQPIYPFIWWQHDPGPVDLDHDVWEMTVRTVYQQADGFCLFGGGGTGWSETEPWWVFLKAHLQTGRGW